jgi:hypothetical protein
MAAQISEGMVFIAEKGGFLFRSSLRKFGLPPWLLGILNREVFLWGVPPQPFGPE